MQVIFGTNTIREDYAYKMFEVSVQTWVFDRPPTSYIIDFNNSKITNPHENSATTYRNAREPASGYPISHLTHEFLPHISDAPV